VEGGRSYGGHAGDRGLTGDGKGYLGDGR